MITPNANQNILNFSICRFINEVSPIYQIDTLLSNMASISDKLNSSEMISSNRANSLYLSEFGRYLVSDFAYTSYDSFSIGYSQPLLMGYLSETHSSNIDSNDLTSVSPQINSYIQLTNIAPYNANRIWSLINPHRYIITNPSALNIGDISKILTTVQLEDIAPSDVSMSNQIFTYTSLLDIVDFSLGSNVFDTGTGSGSLSYSGYLYNATSAVTGISLPTISSDIANFLSDDGVFYNNLTLKLIAIAGIAHASPEYISSIKNMINFTLKNYIIHSTNSFINYIDPMANEVVISAVDMYSTLVKNELSKNILDFLISGNFLKTTDIQEALTIRSIYELYSDTYSDTILDIESACSRLSNSPLDLINMRIHLYSGLFASLDSFVTGECSSFFQTQQEIAATISNTDLVTKIENEITLNSFSTASINNKKMMDAAVATSITSKFETYISTQQSNVSYSNDLLRPIIDVVLFNNHSLAQSKLLESAITDAIITEFNHSCWSRLNDVLLVSYPKFTSSFNYSLPLGVLQNTEINLKQIYNRKAARNKGSGILPKVISTSIFNTVMNASLDEYSIPKTV